jgi:HPt (histidine-containing phosphotransfer) domain-containing protein
MDEYLAKPFRSNELAYLLEKVIKQKGGFSNPTTKSAAANVDFDVEHLGQLLAAVGAETFRLLVGDFVSTIDALFEQLEKALASRDEPCARLIVHRLVGVVGQYGGRHAANLAKDLEFAEREHLFEGIEDLMARCRQFRSEVLTWCRRQGLAPRDEQMQTVSAAADRRPVCYNSTN